MYFVSFIFQEFLIHSFSFPNFFPETGIHERRLIRLLSLLDTCCDDNDDKYGEM